MVIAALVAVCLAAWPATAQPRGRATDYVLGPGDVVSITSYDQASLTGKFTLESDGTFTFPFIGRMTASGLSVRQLEDTLRRRLKDEGYFTNPQVTVSVETYKSQEIYVVGEVRTPGAYALSGDMGLVEAIARAGSALATASGEVIVVRRRDGVGPGPVLPSDAGALKVERVDLRALQNATITTDIVLRDGDTLFVPRADNVFVLGQVKNPGAYPMPRGLTVLQALSLAGGVTDRGTTRRVRIVRTVNGQRQEVKAELTDLVLPDDTIVVAERIF